jgi:hypothetical protein
MPRFPSVLLRNMETLLYQVRRKAAFARKGCECESSRRRNRRKRAEDDDRIRVRAWIIDSDGV